MGELRGKRGKTYAYTNMLNRWRNEKNLAWFSGYTRTHGSVIRHFYMTPLGLGLSNISRKSVRMNNDGFVRANARISFIKSSRKEECEKALISLKCLHNTCDQLTNGKFALALHDLYSPRRQP